MPAAYGTFGPTGSAAAYGTIPKPISVAPNTYQQIQGLYPNLTQTANTAFGNVNREMAGGIDPQLQSYAAQLGWSSGMPGLDPGGFNSVRALQLGEQQAYNRRRQGTQDFQSLLSSLAPTQTSPELATNVADRNALYAAAPDPAAAAAENFRLWMQQYNLLSGAGRGPAGGTGPITINRGLGGQIAPPTPGAAGGGAGYNDAAFINPGNSPYPGEHGSGVYAGAPSPEFDWNAWRASLIGPQDGTASDLLLPGEDLSMFQ